MFYGMVSFISMVIDSSFLMSHSVVTGFLLVSMCASGFVYVCEYISVRCRMTETSNGGNYILTNVDSFF